MAHWKAINHCDQNRRYLTVPLSDKNDIEAHPTANSTHPGGLRRDKILQAAERACAKQRRKRRKTYSGSSSVQPSKEQEQQHQQQRRSDLHQGSVIVGMLVEDDSIVAPVNGPGDTFKQYHTISKPSRLNSLQQSKKPQKGSGILLASTDHVDRSDTARYSPSHTALLCQKSTAETPHHQKEDETDDPWASFEKELSGMEISDEDADYEYEDEICEDIMRDLMLVADSNATRSSTQKPLSSTESSNCAISPLQPQSHADLTPIGPSPFIRRTQPDLLQDFRNCPIPLLSASRRIPTCFRIAEALRELAHCEANDVVSPFLAIELYAIILIPGSHVCRNTWYFRLADVFISTEPSYISGQMNALSDSALSLRLDPILHHSSKDGSQSTSGEHTLVRAILRPLPHSQSQSIGPNSTVNNSQGLRDLSVQSESSCSLLAINNHLFHLPQVEIQGMWATSWDEIQYVRGIVDPAT